MKKKQTLFHMGSLLILESLAMIPSLLLSFQETSGSLFAFLAVTGLLCATGLFLSRFRGNARPLSVRESYLLAAASWILFIVCGAIPYLLSGVLSNPADAVFEAASGFTTTGASVFQDVESLPGSILLWRGTTNWIGGLGILVFMAALLPATEARMPLIYEEIPGPVKEKVSPRAVHSAKRLLSFYLSGTLILIVLLCWRGMSVFDSVVHAFTTVSTGGFSTWNQSVGAVNSPCIEVIITFFMLFYGTNTGIFFLLLRGRFKEAGKNGECRTYYGIGLIWCLGIALDLTLHMGLPAGEAIRASSFQVASIFTTTGFATTDFSLWPTFSKFMLIALMLIGGCAGSTAGGLKVVRLRLLMKIAGVQLRKLRHPHSYAGISLNERTVNPGVARDTMAFLFLYLGCIFAVWLLASLDEVSGLTAVTAAISAMGNIGPGLDLVGPAGSYGSLSDLSKYVLSLLMTVGRLEIFPVLALFTVRRSHSRQQ